MNARNALAVRPAADPATDAPDLSDATRATLIERPAPAIFDDEDRYGGHALPRDHPAWSRDAVSLSQRARAHLATLRSFACDAASWWSGRTRAVALALPSAGFARTLRVDANGFYSIGW